MAGRVKSRRALRDEHDRAEVVGEVNSANADETDGPNVKGRKPRVKKALTPKAPKTKAPPKPRVRRKSTKVLPRMFAQWAVCDGGLKHVAMFQYKDRAGADDKLAELLSRKPGAYHLQLVKVAYDPLPAAEPVAAV